MNICINKIVSKEEMLQIPAEEISRLSALYADPLVSVVMMTRNHENYIRQAVESVIDQEADFPIEILIGEDFSTDNTRKECEKLQQEYFQVIRLIVAEQNVGITPNFLRLACRARGKYIALLEGDDYWIHPKKLALQVELMENHPEYSWCVGKTEGRKFWVKEKPSYTLEDILEKYIFHTSTFFFRSNLLTSYPNFPNAVCWDAMLSVYLTNHGQCGFVDKPLSFYRRHQGGLYTGANSAARYELNKLFFESIQSYLDNKFTFYLCKRSLWFVSMESSINIDKFALPKWIENIKLMIFIIPSTVEILPLKSLIIIFVILLQPLTFLYLYTRRKLALKSRLEGLIKVFRNQSIDQ